MSQRKPHAARNSRAVVVAGHALEGHGEPVAAATSLGRLGEGEEAHRPGVKGPQEAIARAVHEHGAPRPGRQAVARHRARQAPHEARASLTGGGRGAKGYASPHGPHVARVRLGHIDHDEVGPAREALAQALELAEELEERGSGGAAGEHTDRHGPAVAPAEVVPEAGPRQLGRRGALAEALEAKAGWQAGEDHVVDGRRESERRVRAAVVAHIEGRQAHRGAGGEEGLRPLQHAAAEAQPVGKSALARGGLAAARVPERSGSGEG